MKKQIIPWIRNTFTLSLDPFARKDLPHKKAQWIIQAIYYFLAFQGVSVLQGLEGYVAQEGNFSPVWSLFWTNNYSLDQVIVAIRLIFLTSTLIGAFFYWHRLGRIIAFVGIFQFHAFASSFDQPDHHWYPWVYITFLLMFLPSTWKKTVAFGEKKKFLFVFFCLQLTILLIYSFAGVSKLTSGISQAILGQANVFSKDALALHIAYWLSATDATSILGPFIVYNPIFGWPFFVLNLFLQAFAVYAVVKPVLQKYWAMGLIFFHIATYLTMKILLLGTTPLLLFLFFDSPFLRNKPTFKEVVYTVPILGFVLRALRLK